MGAPIRYSANVVLDGNGRGAVRIAPAGKDWTIRYLSVRCSDVASEAIASLYENVIGPDYLIDVSFTGSSGDTTDTVIDVRDGYGVWIEWVGGTPGTTATVTYTGEEF